MAGHHLIDGYLAGLARVLPAGVVDELAGGLAEAYGRQRRSGLDPDAAAFAAISGYGAPGVVLGAFARPTPGRRLARALVLSGPLVGLCWAATLVLGHA